MKIFSEESGNQLTFYITSLVILNLIYFNLINTPITEEASLNEKYACRNFGRDGIVTKDGWLPQDCKLFNYSDDDARRCLKIRGSEGINKIAFYGDSRLRHTYIRLTNMISTTKLSYGLKTKDLDYTNDTAKLEAHMYWNVYFDAVTRERYEDILKPENLKNLPHMILVCVAMWPILYPGRSTFADHVRDATLATDIIKKVAKLTRVYYVSAEFAKEGHNVTHAMILKYNNLTRQLLINSDVMMMESSFELAKTRFDNYLDNAHPGHDVINHKFQMIFNSYCNSVMNLTKDYCCSRVKYYQPRSAMQSQQPKPGCFGLCEIKQIIEGEKFKYYLTIFNCCSVIFLFALNERKKHKPRSAAVVPNNIYDTFICTIQYAVILMFIYLADRTTIFNRAEKSFSFSTFTGPLILLFIIGCFLREESKDTTIMNRNITDELKGWMQLIILFYHTSGASSIYPIYFHIRVLVSTYIFLTGFGHFVYYWKGGALSFKRYAMGRRAIIGCRCS